MSPIICIIHKHFSFRLFANARWAFPEIRCTPSKEDMGIPQKYVHFSLGIPKKIKHFFGREGKKDIGIPKNFDRFSAKKWEFPNFILLFFWHEKLGIPFFFFFFFFYKILKFPFLRSKFEPGNSQIFNLNYASLGVPVISINLELILVTGCVTREYLLVYCDCILMVLRYPLLGMALVTGCSTSLLPTRQIVGGFEG